MATLTLSLDTGSGVLTASKTIQSAQLTRAQTAIAATVNQGGLSNQQLMNYLLGALIAQIINITRSYEQANAASTVTDIAFS